MSARARDSDSGINVGACGYMWLCMWEPEMLRKFIYVEINVKSMWMYVDICGNMWCVCGNMWKYVVCMWRVCGYMWVYVEHLSLGSNP